MVKNAMKTYHKGSSTNQKHDYKSLVKLLRQLAAQYMQGADTLHHGNASQECRINMHESTKNTTTFIYKHLTSGRCFQQ